MENIDKITNTLLEQMHHDLKDKNLLESKTGIDVIIEMKKRGLIEPNQPTQSFKSVEQL